MRLRFPAFALLVLIGCSSCSYQRGYETGKVLERSINEFHEQLNDQRYHEIYSQADPELRNRISEADFTARLLATHEQLGKTTDRALVSIKDSFGRILRQTFGPARELIPHSDLVGSENTLGKEQFVWAVEKGQARLISYEFEFLCKKPCTVGFGYGTYK